MNKLIALLLVSLVIFSGCTSDEEEKIEKANRPKNELGFSSPVSFNYATSIKENLSIEVQDNNGAPMQNVVVSVYDKDTAQDGQLIARGVTQGNGIFMADLKLPSYTTEVFVVANTLGMVNTSTVKVNGNRGNHIFGGKQPQKRVNTTYSAGKAPYATAGYNYLSGYDSEGVPDNKEAIRDIVDASFLYDINGALPESLPVHIHNPHYLLSSNKTDIEISEDAEVWVTFVHEGAGYKNTLGFYTYDLNNPPATKNDIDTINFVFPNASFLGGGGGLVAGDKVKIGQFKAGTGIGWVLIQNAWTGTSVNTNKTHFYSNADFNPETLPNWKQHSVALLDIGRNLVLVGFEDLNRNGGAGDNDFNDLVFYATSNPLTAFNTNGMQNLNSSIADSDGDGIGDYNDAYPTDPTKAFNNYTPTASGFGTLAFEDLWPSKGDYDFNDLVLDYRINEVTDANNDIVELKAKFVIKAIGGGFHNGFGFEIPVSPSDVASVTGSDLSKGYIITNANGTEAGQTNAVIMVFDDAYSRMQPSGGAFVNTNVGANYVTPDTIDITVVFAGPVNKSILGYGPYNPFMIANEQRGYEIHLAGFQPTDLVDVNLFGQFDDNTDVSSNTYYKSASNLPWAIDLSAEFNYPSENNSIESTYLKFYNWAQSGGNRYKDWYTNKSPSYRDRSKIY